MTELLLDPSIRTWVFVPIVIITFLVGILRHYIFLLFLGKKKGDLQSVKDGHLLMKARLLRENGRFLPSNSFGMRKHWLADEQNGQLLKRVEKQSSQPNPAFDPSMMTEMLKGNMLNMIPMIFIGGWINWTFSGFVTTKVPFPLTLRFKPMLQRGVDLMSLDAAWVSSASWYFLNVFGLRSVYALVLGGENAADQIDEQAMMGQPQISQGQDPKAAFKAEWEALQLYTHNFSTK
uniref:ER membrane protein complex subunit 3 n=2 Tax=Meloidogyne TaxID=189290 RepID=A0A914LFS4_MELIC